MKNAVQKYNFIGDVCEMLWVNVLWNVTIEAEINSLFEGLICLLGSGQQVENLHYIW